jgi:hypothetical protein
VYHNRTQLINGLGRQLQFGSREILSQMCKGRRAWDKKDIRRTLK